MNAVVANAGQWAQVIVRFGSSADIGTKVMEKNLAGACSLYEEFCIVAEKFRESVALVYGDESLTYLQLRARVDVTADILRMHGIDRGQAFALYGRNCPEFLYCYLAAAKIGAVFVSINANVTESEVGYILKHSDARLMFHDEFVAEVANTSALQHLSRPLEELKRSVPAESRFLYEPVDPSDDLLIVYTSGSTGAPKAVVLTHAAQIGAARSIADFWSLNPGDATVVAAPMGFLLGLSTSALVPMLSGVKVVLNKRFHPGEVLEALAKYNATLFHGVPTMYSMMLDYSVQQNRTFDLSSMRVMICSGAPMPDEMVQQFTNRFGKMPQNYFGMTECYPLVGTYATDEEFPPKGAVGRLAPGAKVKFLDNEGRECSPGMVGEMYARASSMLKRYHKAADLTKAALVDGWFRTGDNGYVSLDGFIYITGRLKDLIIRGGANIAPLEVENALLTNAKVQSVAVIGVPDRIYGEVPVAFVVKQRGAVVSSEELIEFSKKQLADFKVPTMILFRDELPLGKTGKIDKNQLKIDWQMEISSCEDLSSVGHGQQPRGA